MSGVPNVFGSATSSIPLSQLDVNFNTPLYIGNTSVGLGNTVTSFGNVTLVNATLTSANVSISGGTANGVVYINSSNVAVASPTVLAFDGSNLGLGVTPSAWGTVFKVLESGASGSYQSSLAFQTNNNAVNLFTNAYYNGSNYVYKNNGYALQYGLQNSQHQWFVAPSGTAGNAITFTQAMTLNNSGTLVINSSGQGIQFTNSSALANSTLNDYETGTWTPTLTPGSGSLSGYTSSGQYTKVGRMVYVIGNVNITGAGTSGGTMTIGALPFTTLSTTARPSIPIAREDQTTGVIYSGYVNIGTTTAQITTLTGGNPLWVTGYNYSFCFTYQATF